jgi:hypothetical protein
MTRYQCLVTYVTGVEHEECRTDDRDAAEAYCAEAIDDGCLRAEVQATVGGVTVSYWDAEELEFQGRTGRADQRG